MTNIVTYSTQLPSRRHQPTYQNSQYSPPPPPIRSSRNHQRKIPTAAYNNHNNNTSSSNRKLLLSLRIFLMGFGCAIYYGYCYGMMFAPSGEANETILSLTTTTNSIITEYDNDDFIQNQKGSTNRATTTTTTPTSLRQNVLEFLQQQQQQQQHQQQTQQTQHLTSTATTTTNNNNNNATPTISFPIINAHQYWSVLHNYATISTIRTYTMNTTENRTNNHNDNATMCLECACTDPPGQGWEGGSGAYQLLHDKIRIVSKDDDDDDVDVVIHDDTDYDHDTNDDTTNTDTTTIASDDNHNHHHPPPLLSSSRHPAQHIRLLCAMYTHTPNHHLVRMAALTWGLQCDGFIAFTTTTSTTTTPTTASTTLTNTTATTPFDSDISAFTTLNTTGTSRNKQYHTNTLLGIISIPLQVGNESYANMWQKTRAIWKYIYSAYNDNYDYIHLSGDDIYLLVPNLKYFLYTQEQAQSQKSVQSSSSSSIDVFAGQWVRQKHRPYVGGGPGYTISRSVLQQYIQYAHDDCYPTTISSAEDRYFSLCLQKYTNVTLTDTRNVETGEQTYHDVAPQQVYDGRPSSYSHRRIPSFHSRAVSYYETLPHPKRMPQQHVTEDETNTTTSTSTTIEPWRPIASSTLPFDDNHHYTQQPVVGPKYGLNAAAKYSISFHKISHPLFMLRIHAILYPSICQQEQDGKEP